MAIFFIQPKLPSYRIDFFQRLAAHYGDHFSVYYSDADTEKSPRERWACPVGDLLRPIPGMEWQSGQLRVPFERDDTVVVSGAPRNVSTLLTLMRARIIGARTIWWGHYWSATSELYRHRLRMRLSRLANALLFYTDAEVERFHTDGWSHTGVVGALNNGVDVTEIQRWRTPFDSAARGRNLLFIGRVTEKSQLHLAIEALRSPLLKATHLHIIGSGSEEAALQLQARALGVSDRLSWHGPITDERKISEIANLCSAFVYPGSVGLSLIHGMAYGLPCVVHDNPLRHMPEISAFEDGKSGAAMSENDSASVARVVHSLLENPSEANAMSMYNRKKVDHSYNTKVMADRFIDFERHIAGL